MAAQPPVPRIDPATLATVDAPLSAAAMNRAMGQAQGSAASSHGRPLLHQAVRTASEDHSAGRQHDPRNLGAAARQHLPGLDRSLGQMEVLVRYERSWSIQDSLDQHAALAEQREVLVEMGRNRLRARQTQHVFAEMEVEDSLAAAKSMSSVMAGNAQEVIAKASQVRGAVRDLKFAVRVEQQEQQLVDQIIGGADSEIEKGRLEMVSMKEVIEDKSLGIATDDATTPPEPPVDQSGAPLKQKYNYCTNCKVGGHGQRFCEYFLERPNWRVYPHQKWFEDEKRNEYFCPLGKKLVDFADESHFSRIAMYLKGRAWLEEKTKVLELAPGIIPETYIIEKGAWKDGKEPPADSEVSNLPWFVKEADRNWGTSVHVCAKPSECIGLAKADSTYVVQQHIKDPLLMSDGRKCHIKFYVLLIGLEDGVTWNLYTYKDGYLSISPNAWTPEDISKETQVTIIRSERINDWAPWPEVYPKCKKAVGSVMSNAVSMGKLEGRLGKTQFEILSADFIVDTQMNVHMFEFNMSPVLKDPKDAPKVNDADMIRGALHIVAPCEGCHKHEWDFVDKYTGQPPPPPKPKTVDRPADQGEAPIGDINETVN